MLQNASYINLAIKKFKIQLIFVDFRALIKLLVMFCLSYQFRTADYIDIIMWKQFSEFVNLERSIPHMLPRPPWIGMSFTKISENYNLNSVCHASLERDSSNVKRLLYEFQFQFHFMFDIYVLKNVTKYIDKREHLDCVSIEQNI